MHADGSDCYVWLRAGMTPQSQMQLMPRLTFLVKGMLLLFRRHRCLWKNGCHSYPRFVASDCVHTIRTGSYFSIRGNRLGPFYYKEIVMMSVIRVINKSLIVVAGL